MARMRRSFLVVIALAAVVLIAAVGAVIFSLWNRTVTVTRTDAQGRAVKTTVLQINSSAVLPQTNVTYSYDAEGNRTSVTTNRSTPLLDALNSK